MVIDVSIQYIRYIMQHETTIIFQTHCVTYTEAQRLTTCSTNLVVTQL